MSDSTSDETYTNVLLYWLTSDTGHKDALDLGVTQGIRLSDIPILCLSYIVPAIQAPECIDIAHTSTCT